MNRVVGITVLGVVALGACGGAPTPPAVTPESATLVMDATGLGPCREQWWTSCNYGIRVEGPGGCDHRGNLTWDEGPRSELDETQ